MQHALLVQRAVLHLCRRSEWVGDWRKLCAVQRRALDEAAIAAAGGYDAIFAGLAPQDWEGRGKVWEQFRIEIVERDIRLPPLPFYSGLGEKPPVGCCRVCGQPIFHGRSWKPSAGPRHAQAGWHSICYAAYQAWRQPGNALAFLARRQNGLCAYSGRPIARLVELAPNDYRRQARWGSQTHEWRILPEVEVDHFVPLWRVAGMVASWPRVLDYWGVGNLRAVLKEAHKQKSRIEAGQRARMRLEGQDLLL